RVVTQGLIPVEETPVSMDYVPVIGQPNSIPARVYAIHAVLNGHRPWIFCLPVQAQTNNLKLVNVMKIGIRHRTAVSRHVSMAGYMNRMEHSVHVHLNG